MTTRHLIVSLIAAAAMSVGDAVAETSLDVEYAQIDGQALKLDLHTPKAANPPLIVYVHGGAWRAGSKADVPIAKLLDHGFAIASVDYRLSTQAVFRPSCAARIAAT